MLGGGSAGFVPRRGGWGRVGWGRRLVVVVVAVAAVVVVVVVAAAAAAAVAVAAFELGNVLVVAVVAASAAVVARVAQVRYYMKRSSAHLLALFGTHPVAL